MYQKYVLYDKAIEKARIRAKKIGILKNSVLNGRGNVAGALGEIMARRAYGGKFINTKPELYHYDILGGYKIFPENLKLEIKTKKTGPDIDSIRSSWDGTITKKNKKEQKEDIQNCDFFVFCRVNMTTRIGWVIGHISREDFIDKCIDLNKGDVDPSNGWIVRQACWNIGYKELVKYVYESNTVSKQESGKYFFTKGN